MGIVLRDEDDGQIVFYLKGADNIIKEKVSLFHSE